MSRVERSRSANPPAATNRGARVRKAARAADDADAAVEMLLAPMLRQSTHVLRGFKSIARTHDTQLRSAVDAAETEVFVKAWVHPDHWEASAKALKSKP